MKIIRSKKFVIRGGASNRALTYLTEMTTYKNLSIKSSSRREEINFDRITARTFYSSGVSPRSVRSLDCPLINTLVVNDSRRTGQASCNDALTPFKRFSPRFDSPPIMQNFFARIASCDLLFTLSSFLVFREQKSGKDS